MSQSSTSGWRHIILASLVDDFLAGKSRLL